MLVLVAIKKEQVDNSVTTHFIVPYAIENRMAALIKRQKEQFYEFNDKYKEWEKDSKTTFLDRLKSSGLKSGVYVSFIALKVLKDKDPNMSEETVRAISKDELKDILKARFQNLSTCDEIAQEFVDALKEYKYESLVQPVFVELRDTNSWVTWYDSNLRYPEWNSMSFVERASKVTPWIKVYELELKFFTYLRSLEKQPTCKKDMATVPMPEKCKTLVWDSFVEAVCKVPDTALADRHEPELKGLHPIFKSLLRCDEFAIVDAKMVEDRCLYQNKFDS